MEDVERGEKSSLKRRLDDDGKSEECEVKKKARLQEEVAKKGPLKDTKFGRCPNCKAAMQVVPPQAGSHPKIGCPTFLEEKCVGHYRAARPEEEQLIPASFVE